MLLLSLRFALLSGLLDPVQDHHSQSTSLLFSLIIQYNHNILLKILYFYILCHYDMKLCYSDNLDLKHQLLLKDFISDFILRYAKNMVLYSLYLTQLRTVTGSFAHIPVCPESFRPESFRPRVVSPSITRVVSPSFPESFRPLFDVVSPTF